MGHDSTAGVEDGSGRGHGCCFETLNPPLPGRDPEPRNRRLESAHQGFLPSSLGLPYAPF